MIIYTDLTCDDRCDYEWHNHHLQHPQVKFSRHTCVRDICDEGPLPEMRIWYILLIKSGLKLCIHLGRSIFSFLNVHVSCFEFQVVRNYMYLLVHFSFKKPICD